MVKTMELCFAVRVVKQKLRHEPGAVVRICICTLKTKPSPCNNTLWSTIFGGSQRQRSKQPTKRNARPMIPNLTKAHSDDHEGSLKKNLTNTKTHHQFYQNNNNNNNNNNNHHHHHHHHHHHRHDHHHHHHHESSSSTSSSS